MTASENSDVSRFLDSVLGNKTRGSPDAVSLSRASIPGDRMIILWWKRGDVQPCGSDLALRIVQFLKKYGLVDHTAWVDRGNDVV